MFGFETRRAWQLDMKRRCGSVPLPKAQHLARAYKAQMDRHFMARLNQHQDGVFFAERLLLHLLRLWRLKS